MLRRFASAATVASILVACAATIIGLLPADVREQVIPVLLAWVCLPAIWGAWATLTPATWTPDRLPVWGSLLGVLAGVGALFLVDAPKRLLGFDASVVERIAGVFAFAAFYFLLWMLVRRVLLSLTAAEELPAGRGADNAFR